MNPALTVFFMAVVKPCHTAPPKHHLILSKGPCLIGKEVLNLPKVLGDVQGSALNGRIHFLIVEIYIALDEIDLAELHDLDGHVERNGDQDLRKRKQLSKARASAIR